MNIPSLTFLEIYEEIIKQFSDQYKEKNNESPKLMQIFGLKGHDTENWTLRDAIFKSAKVKNKLGDREDSKNQAIVFNAKYLYNKALEQKSKATPTSEVRIAYPYNQFIFWYLGYDNYDDYQKKRGKTAILYKAYYYSFKYHQIRSFTISINYEVKPSYPGVQYQDFSVKEWDFHDSHKKRTYEGYAYILEGKLQLILWNRSDGDRLRIMLESGDNPKENKTMRGTILAVLSSAGRPLSNAEIVVSRMDDSSIGERDILRIRRYLFLHRYNFRIRAQSINLKRMDAKGEGVDVMRHFVGVWKTYRYDDNYDQVLRSIIWVSEDYRIVCFNSNYDQDNLNEQVCLPNITIDTELNTKTICMDCFPKEGANIISSIMLNLPSANDKEKISGTITLVGQDGGFPSMKGLVLFRDEALEEEVNKRPAQTRTGFLKDKLRSLNRPPKKEIVAALAEIEKANHFPG